MSISDAVSFCQRMSTDSELERRAARALDGAAGPAAAAELVALGAAEGLEFSAEELGAAGRRLASGIELSEDQLTAVAGGVLGTSGDDGQLQEVRLQSTLDEQLKLLQTLSNALKSSSADATTITRNLC